MSQMAMEHTAPPAPGIAVLNAGARDVAAPADDAALIERSRTGDAQAIALLVERHADAAFRIAYRLVGRKAEAEDIAQDVLMRMLSYREGWLSKTSFHVWIRRAVYNRTVDVYRKQRPWQHRELEAAADVDDGSPAQDTALAARRREARVAAAVLALPLRQRMAVTLCFYEQMSLAEAGEVLKTSAGAVESLLHRAKQTLKQKLIGIEE